MSAMIQHDLYEEFHAERGRYRDFERDAMHDADAEEKIFDDDMWRVYADDLSVSFHGRVIELASHPYPSHVARRRARSA